MRSLLIRACVLVGALSPMLASAVTPMVSASAQHTVAVRSDGTVVAWGANINGQLGDGTTTNRLSAAAVPGLTGVVAVAAGGSHTVALKSDGTVMTWGDNSYGQLGDGTTTQRLSPVVVTGLTGVKAVAAGKGSTVALKSDDSVVTWGWNCCGQLGDGSATNRLSPVAVPGLSGITAVASGNEHIVALKSDHTVVAWGNNGSGQLGDGTTTERHSPVTVPGLSGVDAVTAGNSYTVVLKSDGTAMAWGYNGWGQLGDGSITNRSSPVAVAGLTGVAAVAAGFSHTLALKSDGTVMVWGTGTSGELGDGMTQHYSPAVIPGLSGVVALEAGYFHSVALKSDGTMLAWGYNAQGQLGDGTTTQRSSPVIALGQLLARTSQTIGSISLSSPNTLAVGGTTTVSANATSGLAVTYSSLTEGVCAVTGSTVTGVAAGTCSIAANQAGNTTYSAATQVTQSISIAKASQSVSFGTAPTISVSGTGTVSASATSGLAVSFASSTTGVCSVNGSTVTGIAAGTCIITANQAGSTGYLAATQVTQTFTVASAPAAGTAVNLVPSWNLLANNGGVLLDVASVFGDATKFTTVWKWNRTTGTWAFYAPSMTAPALAAYAQGKGYDVLTSIDPKEGFWVNASKAAVSTVPAATGVALYASDLQAGWNLAGSTDNKTPSQLIQALAGGLAAAGKSIVTAWSWDAANAKWKFFAPSLEAQGGTVQADYIAGKGFLPFSTAPFASEGFWLNVAVVNAPLIEGPIPTVNVKFAIATIGLTGTLNDDGLNLNLGSISDDGRYVAFAQDYANLRHFDIPNIAGDGCRQKIFIKDMTTGYLRPFAPPRLQSGNCGAFETPIISGNGKYVFFNGYLKTFYRDGVTRDVYTFGRYDIDGSSVDVASRLEGGASLQLNGSYGAGDPIDARPMYLASDTSGKSFVFSMNFVNHGGLPNNGTTSPLFTRTIKDITSGLLPLKGQDLAVPAVGTSFTHGWGTFGSGGSWNTFDITGDGRHVVYSETFPDPATGRPAVRFRKWDAFTFSDLGTILNKVFPDGSPRDYFMPGGLSPAGEGGSFAKLCGMSGDGNILLLYTNLKNLKAADGKWPTAPNIEESNLLLHDTRDLSLRLAHNKDAIGLRCSDTRQPPRGLSADGNIVVSQKDAFLYVTNRAKAKTIRIPFAGLNRDFQLSRDGRYILKSFSSGDDVGTGKTFEADYPYAKTQLYVYGPLDAYFD